MVVVFFGILRHLSLAIRLWFNMRDTSNDGMECVDYTLSLYILYMFANYSIVYYIYINYDILSCIYLYRFVTLLYPNLLSNFSYQERLSKTQNNDSDLEKGLWPRKSEVLTSWGPHQSCNCCFAPLKLNMEAFKSNGNIICISMWWFQFFLCSPLPGEMIQFDEHTFQVGWNHQLDIHAYYL